MFGPLGGTELLLILVIALIVFGPRKLPDIGKSMGRMMAEFRRASNEFKRTIEDEVEAEKATPPPAAAIPADVTPPSAYDPVTEASVPVTEAAAPVPEAEPAPPVTPVAPDEPTVSRDPAPPASTEPR